MKVLVAGAGYVGLRLAERLVVSGAEVFTLSRSGRSVLGATGLLLRTHFPTKRIMTLTFLVCGI